MFSEPGAPLERKIALMREWFTSPQYRAVREARRRRDDGGIVFPK
jgi:hypothetical protein